MILHTAYLALRSVSDSSDYAFATKGFLFGGFVLSSSAALTQSNTSKLWYWHTIMQLYLDDISCYTLAGCCAALYSTLPGCAKIICVTGIA